MLHDGATTYTGSRAAFPNYRRSFPSGTSTAPSCTPKPGWQDAMQVSCLRDSKHYCDRCSYLDISHQYLGLAVALLDRAMRGISTTVELKSYQLDSLLRNQLHLSPPNTARRAFKTMYQTTTINHAYLRTSSAASCRRPTSS